jgi:hypothetical protein
LLFQLHEINGTFRGGHSITLADHEGKQESWFVSVTGQKNGTIESIHYVTPSKVLEKCEYHNDPKFHTVEIYTIEPTRKIRVTIYTEGHKRYPPSPNRIYGDIEIIEENT